jgi:transcriptional regulator with XRE-family HTH domain
MGDEHDIGLALKRLREEAGLSQRQLAEQLNVQQPAVARWEAGGVRMPINRVEHILGHFGYGIEYDLRAIPLGVAVNDGMPLRLVRRRSETLGPAIQPRVKSGEYEFAVNNDAPWFVDMWEATSHRKLPGAIAVYPERIEEVVAHPDGALIRFGGQAGKISTNAKPHEGGSIVFAYSVADQHYLELSGVDHDPAWSNLTIRDTYLEKTN